MYATFNRFEIKMTLEQARGAAHQGDCEADARALAQEPSIARQLDKIGPEAIREELREYGAWDAEELANEEMSRVRIVWLAAGNICEEHPRR